MTGYDFTASPAWLSIDVLEGQGVWLTLDGPLIDGSTDQVASRLYQLARLGFQTMIIDVTNITDIDDTMVTLLRDTVQEVHRRDGIVILIDPTNIASALANQPGAGCCVVRYPPTGTWWQIGSLGKPRAAGRQVPPRPGARPSVLCSDQTGQAGRRTVHGVESDRPTVDRRPQGDVRVRRPGPRPSTPTDDAGA